MKRAREYRKDARTLLEGGVFGTKFLYAVLVVLVIGAIEALLSATVVGTLATLVLMGPLSYGSIVIFRRVVQNKDEKANLNHLFDGFKDRFSESLVTSLLETLFIILWTLLLIVPGIIKSYSYAADMYLVHEKGIEGKEAITKSRELMRGNKWKLFCLDLSFIGWYFVGILCFGVGVLWVEAYRNVARTEFFEDILKQEKVVDVQ